MFDVSSKRYYYPFTSCSCCGGNYSFLNSYPYKRENTSFKFVVPCKNCQEEIDGVGFRESHHINSCHKCGVPVRLLNGTKERYANDAGSFRTMFEVCARAIDDDKKVLIKTTMGYRVFYKTDKINTNSILMMINASKITDNLSLITEEFNALLSIERPIIDVTLKNEELKSSIDANTSYVKYPDDGFCILLGAELQKLGYEYIAYEDCSNDYDADIVMDYDLEIYPQSDMRIFLNKDTQFIASGERVSFPSKNLKSKNLLSIDNNLIGVPSQDKMFFDRMEHFNSVDVEQVHILEGIEKQYHSKQKHYSKDEASFMSVIAEHNLFDEKCICAHFDNEPSFLYYNAKSVIKVVPPKHFSSKDLIENMKTLREGSHRLIENLEKTMPEVYNRLKDLQTKDEVNLFEAIAVILGQKDESMRGVTKEAMKFIGKGGIQIDTHVKDNRFDNIAFLSSIISYMMAGVSKEIIAYSIFESFGDYFSELINELQEKTKSSIVVLCGSGFANQSLYSRMQRNFKTTPLYMNINYPIGDENSVVGAVYI
jgi:hydrogenase maturation factor HypF (carbamoyltransferase family)